jgi:hypothetical protein
MNAFVKSAFALPTPARTANGMKAQKNTTSPVVDLFYNIGASRGKNIIPEFEAAMQADEDLALRIALWARDVRGGAGERELFRNILRHMEKTHPEILLNTKLLDKVAEVGRWDDLLVFNYNPAIKSKAFDLIHAALAARNGLAAKWMPRKGSLAVELRTALGLSPKAYRKTLVGLSKTVEQAMCAKEYERINYEHVPSLAMSRYMKAFSKNDAARFVAYRESLKKGEAKVNAGAVYPYDVIKGLKFGGINEVADAQWAALPNYMNDMNVLPMVDVSGSMCCSAGGNPNLTCLDVSVSLGLYCADKNKGAYKDMFLTFSGKSELVQLKGSLSQKHVQLRRAHWEMNTNLHAAFAEILRVAVAGKVPESDMPQVVLILSDMQFDQCARYDDSAIEMVRRKYEAAGYKVPTVVFWNLNASGNAPVSFNEKGVALISGFSPAIMKAVLAADFDTLSPESIVRDAVAIPRYDYK